MPAANQMSTLVGMFKETYGDKVIDLAKTKARLSTRIKLTEAAMVGNKYHQPVDLQMEHGWTAAAANASGPVTLLASNAGASQDAQLEGAQLFGRAQVDYEAMFRAAGNNDKKAFIGATKHVVKRTSNAGVKRLEMMLLHGRRGNGTILSQSGAAGTRAIVINVDSWSPAIWAGSKNATLDAFAADYTGSKLNTNAPIVVVSVDTVTRTINVSGNATDLDALTVGRHLFWETFSPTTEFAGIDASLRNVGSLHNIDAAVYDLWAGNVFSTSLGAINMALLLEMIGRGPAAYENDEDLLAICAPRAFEVMNGDQAALRDFDVSYSPRKAEQGSELLTFHCQTGKVELLSHPLQKDGLLHVLPVAEAKRIGATDLTFIKRHGSDEVLILELSGQAGSEMRCYSNQALLIEQPRHTTMAAGITYT